MDAQQRQIQEQLQEEHQRVKEERRLRSLRIIAQSRNGNMLKERRSSCYKSISAQSRRRAAQSKNANVPSRNADMPKMFSLPAIYPHLNIDSPCPQTGPPHLLIEKARLQSRYFVDGRGYGQSQELIAPCK